MKKPVEFSRFVGVPRARDWGQAHAARLALAKNDQASLCVFDAPLRRVFDPLPLAIRYDVYLREHALTPGTPDGELETWTWEQRNPALLGLLFRAWLLDTAHGGVLFSRRDCMG